MATKKIRVYELARELGVENAVVLDLANELKIGVKSHSSSIDDPSATRPLRRRRPTRRAAPLVVRSRPRPVGVRSRRRPAAARSRPRVRPAVARPAPAGHRPARPEVVPAADAEAASRAVAPVALPAGRPVVEAGTRVAAVPVPRANGPGARSVVAATSKTSG